MFSIHEMISNFHDYEFLWRAAFICLFVPIGSSVLGIFLHFKGMSLSGDALSHSILPGAVVSFIFFGFSMIPMSIAGLMTGLLVLILMQLIHQNFQIKEDASLSVIYLFSLALGFLLLSLSKSKADLLHFLFGSLFDASWSNVVYGSVLSVLIFVVLFAIKNKLMLRIFDPLFAQSVGVTHFYNGLFNLLMALQLIIGYQMLGSLMAIGLIIIPSLTAKILSQSINKMIVLAILIGWLSAFGGLIGSIAFDLPTGPLIVLFASCAFFLALIGIKIKSYV